MTKKTVDPARGDGVWATHVDAETQVPALPPGELAAFRVGVHGAADEMGRAFAKALRMMTELDEPKAAMLALANVAEGVSYLADENDWMQNPRAEIDDDGLVREGWGPYAAFILERATYVADKSQAYAVALRESEVSAMSG